MNRFSLFVVKCRFIILIICGLLIIPSLAGMLNTKINYDILSYLPESLETVKGQDIMVNEFGSGAFSMVIVDGMKNKDVVKLEDKIESIEHVKTVLWYDDALSLDVPVDMLPNKIKDVFFKDSATMMIALFDNTTSADDTMKAITEMRNTVGKECFISGMSGIVTDIKNLAIKEMPIYVVIAAVLSLIVLIIATDAFVVPFLFLTSIGLAILYNMGSNIFLGQISYITQALVAVLQLGVTMDYSIFLLHSYVEAKEQFSNREEAMAQAITNTFVSVIGSSVTTVAGFAALIFMTFTLGRDLGIVMIKGVIIGVICCVTLLPSLILVFEKLIIKTTHKSFMPNMDKLCGFVFKHGKIWLVIALIAFLPAFYGNNNVGLYYNIDSGLPDTLDSAIANKTLHEQFGMSNVHVLLVDSSVSKKDKKAILDKIDDVDGVEWTLGLNTFIGPLIPYDMLPDKLTTDLMSDEYEMMFVCSNYSSATPEVNNQIAEIDKIVKSYNSNSMVIGEAPLMKDLQDVTDIDLQTVNTVSVLAIFVIVLLVFKSLSIPFILVAVIEFSIFVNMACAYYGGASQPFVAPIVVGTIQLGATVDYAILMTNRYKDERMAGNDKKTAIGTALKTSVKSILTSGFCLFAATVGVAVYSSIAMIKSIVILLSRGALISMVVVIVLLPTMLMIFDRIICMTTIGMKNCTKDKPALSTKE